MLGKLRNPDKNCMEIDDGKRKWTVDWMSVHCTCEKKFLQEWKEYFRHGRRKVTWQFQQYNKEEYSLNVYAKIEEQ